MSKHMTAEERAEARQLLDGQTRWLNMDDIFTRALNTILNNLDILDMERKLEGDNND